MARLILSAPDGSHRRSGALGRVALLTAGAALNIAFLVAVLTPRVPSEYRDYFIDKTARFYVADMNYAVVRIGEPASLAAEANEAILGTGWSDPEPDGRWTIDEAAYLFFRLDGAVRSDLQLELRGHPFLASEGDERTAEVLVNGVSVGTIRLSEPADQAYKVRVPASVRAKRAGSMTVELRFGRLRSPRALGIGPDPRKLGFHMRELTIDEARDLPASR